MPWAATGTASTASSHSVGFAPREQLEGEYIDAVTREGFAIAHDISSYSFAALAKAGRAMMKGRSGALLTMTYLGAVRAVPKYNVMGVAKASLEADMRYLAASRVPRGLGSTPSLPAPFAPWLPQGSRTLGPCSNRSRSTRP